MKKVLLMLLLVVSVAAGRAQDIPSVIGEGISRVIRAVDLVIQRKQTQTIVLQEAQKVLENAMSALELDDIRDWVTEQRDLYGSYFQELATVKPVVSGYHRVKEAIQRQEAIVALYQQGLGRMRQDGHFSAAELAQIESVFAGVLADSENNLGQLLKAVGDGAFSMTDEQRLTIVDLGADGLDKDYRNLQTFSNQARLLSVQRAKDENDYYTLLKLYGL